MALKLGDWAGFKKRRAAARKRGKYRGIGVGNYVDISTGVPREKAEITVTARRRRRTRHRHRLAGPGP